MMGRSLIGTMAHGAVLGTLMLSSSLTALGSTTAQDFELEAPGGETPPAGWTLKVVSGGSGSYNTTAEGDGSNGSGGSIGLAGQMTCDQDGDLPDAYIVNDGYLPFNLSNSITGSYDFYMLGGDSYGTCGLVLGDIAGGAFPKTDAGQLLLTVHSRNNFGNSRSRLVDGTGASVATEPTGRKTDYGKWYRVDFTWAPSSGTTGDFSYTTRQWNSGWQDLYSVAATGFTYTSPTGYVGLADIRATGTRFDNVSVTGTIFAESPATPPEVLTIDDSDDDGIVDTANPLTYTVTFSESMDPSTVGIGSFTNAASSGAALNIDSVYPRSLSVYEVVVTPATPGDLVLGVLGSVTDLSGNPMLASSNDTDTITVVFDENPPEVTSIVSDRDGVTISSDTPVTYTVTFNEPINPATVEVGDFNNASDAPYRVDSVESAGTNVFTVVVTPTGGGGLLLNLAADTVADVTGNTNDTAWPDTNTIAVVAIVTADGTWNSSAGGVWSDPMNWQSNSVASGTNSTATFPSIISADTTVTLDRDFTIGHMVASDNNRNYNISGSRTLALASTAGAPSIDVTLSSRELRVHVPLHTAGGLSKAGPGTLMLNGANVITGRFDVTAGNVRVGDRNNAASMNGGAYEEDISIASGSEFFFYSNIAHTFGGIISGGGELGTGGDGRLTISHTNNTYTGQTSIRSRGPGTPSLSVLSINSVSNSPTLGTVHLPSSSLGAPTNVVDGTIILGSGVAQRSASLIHTGAGETTDRIIEFQWNNSTISRTIAASGSGPLKFVSQFTSAQKSGTRDNQIFLDGTGEGELVGGLNFDPFFYRYFRKRGAGTWTVGGGIGCWDRVFVEKGTLNLTGNNVVTNCPVVISGGTLNATGAQTFGAIAVTVSGGTLAIAGTDCLSDTNSLSISGSGVVQLDAGVREVVGALFIDTIETSAGTWGSSSSRAANKDDEHFSGSGVLYVGVDIPSSGSVLLVK